MRKPFVILMILVIILAVETIVTISLRSFSDELGGIVENSMVIIKSPKPDSYVTSPLNIVGEARGTWFFEATFPVTVLDANGRIVGEGYAQAKDDWMTEEFVPFAATVTFTRPPNMSPGTQSEKGSVVLKKSNPSGLPSNDASYEIPVKFK